MPTDRAINYAERKIKEVQRTGASELVLEGTKTRKLSSLPESLGNLTQLHVLNIEGNNLAELPDWLTNLEELETLNVSNNPIEALPEWLNELRYLKNLYLDDLHLTALPNGLRDLKYLEILSVRDNNLPFLPDWLNDLVRLESLDASANRLTSVPNLSELTQLQVLSLDANQISVLPESLGDLQALSRLELSNNQLTELPDCFHRLRSLKRVCLNSNALSALPSWFGDLGQLEHLPIGGMNLTSLPESLANMKQLKFLYLWGNRIGETPSWLWKLKQLQILNLNSTGISKLPAQIGELTCLTHLFLENNKLVDLPTAICKLKKLKRLELTGNPLNPQLSVADEAGTAAVKRYLRELAKGSRKRYEAKLLILGDGNEGKTCVSRALRNLPFQPQATTRGFDVEQWRFGHPQYVRDNDKDITLNIWDFEGQEINHQTHQFFLTSQALYLLVFRCRDQFLMDRAEYWLDTIRARAPNAKVAVVITQCEERTPYLPQDRLQAQYADVLIEGKWLFPVGCANNSGIKELQSVLKEWSAHLEFMGREWPKSYSDVEAAIKERAMGGTTHLSRSQLYEMFSSRRIHVSGFKDLATSLSTLGVLTHFPDCPDLRDFIVLQPQWLPKAISEIMEDTQLTSDKGEISLRRMRRIWEEKSYPGLFATFHNCMKEFELCYDLEDASRSCLVPLRFGYEKPQIPWTNGKEIKERSVEYKLNIRPPTGIMSRFIVKTHHMIVKTEQHPKGVYWHNGVFLRTGSGPLASEALCEFDSDDRRLSVQVRAAFPQNLLEQIHGYVKAVFSFFSGLEAERSYGCIKFDENTQADCAGRHTERRIFSEILNSQLLNCEYSFHKVDPQRLIFGFSSFGEFVLDKPKLIDLLRSELDKKPEWAESLTQNLGTLLDWLDDNRERINQLVRNQAKLFPEIKQELELKLHEYLSYTSQMLDDRDYTAAPGLISINTKDRSKWNPTNYVKKVYLLTPFCENPNNIHPCEDGHLEFAKARDWWEQSAPWIARGTKVLAAGLQLAFAGMPLALGSSVFDTIKDDVKFMNELTKHMELKADNQEVAASSEILQKEFGEDLRGPDKESKLMRTALARFLAEVAPTNYQARQWGSLSRVRMSDNSYRWICVNCANERNT